MALTNLEEQLYAFCEREKNNNKRKKSSSFKLLFYSFCVFNKVQEEIHNYFWQQECFILGWPPKCFIVINLKSPVFRGSLSHYINILPCRALPHILQFQPSLLHFLWKHVLVKFLQKPILTLHVERNHSFRDQKIAFSHARN